MVSISTSDLNNSTTFPTFSNLPEERKVNEEYFSRKPRKHWCFLGRIISSSVLPVRLTLQVEDREGHKILVAFHTDDRGASFRELCTPGSTIAILYATQHIFAFSPPGIRVEETSCVKVFPYALERMLGTSKTICEREKGDGPTKCDGCHKSDISVKRCARCKTAKYCSKQCQEKGWLAHKEECAECRDVQWFVIRNWELNADAHKFPVELVSWRPMALR